MAETAPTKTIRSTLWPQMEAEAEKRGVPVSSLVNLIMADYLNGDVYVLVPRKRESLPERFQDRAATRPQLAQQPAEPAAGVALDTAKAVVGRVPGRRVRPGG